MNAHTRTLQPAGTLDAEALAALMDRCYSDYEVPMHIDAAAFRFMTRSFDLDLNESRIVSLAGAPVGVGLLGLRGASAWIGGMGVVPEARRAGHAEAIMLALLERAHERDAAEVWLEVLEQNVRAIPLYERLGFAHVRMLDVWRLPAPPAAAAGYETRGLPLAEARALIAAMRRSREPWQRADASVDRWIAEGLALEATVAIQGGTPEGAAVSRAAGERVSVLQLATAAGHEDGGTRALLASLFRPEATQGVRWLNQGEDDPASPVMRALPGVIVEARQREMRRPA